jgi:glucose/mannose-6-phosphate isomerase
VPSILDQPEKIRAIDKSNMLGHCMKTGEYGQEALQLAKEIELPKKRQHQHILIAGMGGSGIGGEILRDWLRDDLRIPMEICNDYTLPAYVNNDTLVFAISYSGNTEETLSAFVDAVRRRCAIITITSGGHLLSSSSKLELPTITIPRILPPRVALPYTFFPLPVILNRMGIVSKVQSEIEEAIQTLRKVSEENAPKIPLEDNQAKRVACGLEDTIPIVYGFREYGAIAHRWKTQFNENSKVPSSYNVFPELNHNETVGWEAPESLIKNLSIILIRDHDEPPEVKYRIDMTKQHVLGKAQKILEIYATGETRLAKMFSVLQVGDLISVYLAILRKVDPTPVGMIAKVKTELTKKSALAEKLAEEIEALAQRIP